MSKSVNEQIAEKVFDNSLSNATPQQLGVKLNTIFNTKVSDGLSKQISVIEYINHIDVLPNKYGFIDMGTLEFGHGEMFITAGIKNSSPSSTSVDGWVPTGALNTLDKTESYSTGKLQGKVINDYSQNDMREYVRNSNMFSKLIEVENRVVVDTMKREMNEEVRYLFGIDVPNTILPTYRKTAIDDIKKNILQNVIDVQTTSSAKEVVEYLRDFMPDYYNNYSDKYNMCSKTPGGNLFIDGVDSGVKAKLNSAEKENTILIISSKFMNQLIKEIGNIYHNEFWKSFTDMFGKVIIDTFDNVGDMILMDKRALRRKRYFDEYDISYYVEKAAYRATYRWAEIYTIIPFLNMVKFTFKTTA